MMFNTVSARQIQREYKKLLERANKINKPIVVLSGNKPQGALIGLDLLEKIQLDIILKEALEEQKSGKTKRITTEKEMEAEFEEIRKASERQ